MSAYEEKAAAALAALKDYTRDLEADLGKIERNRADNPDYGFVQRMVQPGREPGGLVSTNAGVGLHRLNDYKSHAADALSWLITGDVLTTNEVAARGLVQSLYASIQSIHARADAITLIATF
jgi:hypothetical protein